MRERKRKGEKVALDVAHRFSFCPLFATQFRSLLWLLFFRSSTASPAVYMCRDRQPYWHLCTDTLLRFVAVQQAVQYTVRCRFSPGSANPAPKSIRVYLCSSSILWLSHPTLILPFIPVIDARHRKLRSINDSERVKNILINFIRVDANFSRWMVLLQKLQISNNERSIDYI